MHTQRLKFDHWAQKAECSCQCLPDHMAQREINELLGNTAGHTGLTV